MSFNFPRLQTLASFIFLLLTVLFETPLVNAQASSSAPALLRRPTVSQTQIAFSYGGDLWTVDRNGGEARRLTSDVGIETDPYFSPDGSLIAFTGEYDGNEDVYVIPAAGGIPKRLTSHPGSDQVVGWTRDGKRILFRSGRNSYSYFRRLFTVSVEGGLPEEVPLPMAEEGSYSPDGSHLAYVPFTNFSESWGFERGLKHYRGGTASPVWVANLADSSVEKLPRKGAFIVCANHQSYLDAPILTAALPYSIFRNVFYVGTSELFGSGLARAIARFVRVIPVDPDANLVPAMRAGAYGLRHGKILMLYPEGERTIDGAPKSFKKGAAILARHLNVPIVPVAQEGFFDAWPRGRGFQKFAPLRIRIGDPIYPDPAEAPEAAYERLTSELRQRVVAMWEELRAQSLVSPGQSTAGSAAAKH